MSRKLTINDDHLKIFETVPDLYLILSPDLHILTASDAYLEATFTVREEILNSPCLFISSYWFTSHNCLYYFSFWPFLSSKTNWRSDSGAS